MKNALIVVTNHEELGGTGKKTGFYLSEVTHVYYPLKKAGYSVDFASPSGGNAPIDESSRDEDDAQNKQFLNDKELMGKLNNTLALKDVNADRYQVIHFAGGHGTMWDFPESKEAQKVATDIYEHGGIVAAVCHRPTALVNMKTSDGKFLVDGKKVSGFTNAEEKDAKLDEVVPFLLQSKLEERGANFDEGDKWSDKVSISQRLITGQNPQSAKSVGESHRKFRLNTLAHKQGSFAALLLISIFSLAPQEDSGMRLDDCQRKDWAPRTQAL